MSTVSKNDDVDGKKSSTRFELICAAMMGFGQLCIMTGYDSECFILESVIHSIHEREPERISILAGYYGFFYMLGESEEERSKNFMAYKAHLKRTQGSNSKLLVNEAIQAVIYVGYMIACMFSSSIQSVTNPKTCLLFSAVCFTSFPIGFFFTNSYYYYFSSFMIGIGFALFNQGLSGYLASHSTRETIESNISISWAIGCCSMLLGAAIIASVTKLSQSNMDVDIDVTHHVERRFSDLEITLCFTALSAVSIIGIVNCLLLPSKDVENCIESGKSEKSFMDGLKLTMEAMKSPKMIQLIPLFVLCGLNTSFWMSVVPTAINFNINNAGMIYSTAIYGFGAGCGEVMMGLAISFLSKRIKDFCLLPAMFAGTTLITLFCIIVFLSTPYDATYRPTNEDPLLFNHSQPLIFGLALIVGIADCCIKSARSVVCTLVMPKKRPQAFSVSRFHQAWASCLLFFLTPYINIYIYTIGLPILSFIASILFFQTARRIQSMERRKLTIQQKSLHKI